MKILGAAEELLDVGFLSLADFGSGRDCSSLHQKSCKLRKCFGCGGRGGGEGGN